MSKYDRYVISYLDERGGDTLSQSIEVLFEEGDNEARVVRQAKRLLERSTEIPEVSVEAQLLALEEDAFVDLITDVWMEQMSIMGNDKYQYANRLREAINRAQNA